MNNLLLILNFANFLSFCTSCSKDSQEILMLDGRDIIADHTIVSDYEQIPTEYIAKVKKMLFIVAGESHSIAFNDGLEALEAINSKYQVNLSWIPEEYSESHLRLCMGEWGDVNHPSQWVFSYGEEDWYKSELAISTTKNGITYVNETIGNTISSMALAWCWDTEEIDMAPYLSATQEYVDYSKAKGYPTKVIFTTGPVDNCNASGLIGYKKYLAYEAIRNYVNEDPARILFDYADILCYDDGSNAPFTTTYDNKTYPVITPTNLGDGKFGHIGEAGCLRLAKATWWMLARIAGWDGVSTGVGDSQDKMMGSIRKIITSDEITMYLSDYLISWNADLIDFQGILISSQPVISDVISFNASSLASGIYFVVLSNGEKRIIEKIIKP